MCKDARESYPGKKSIDAASRLREKTMNRTPSLKVLGIVIFACLLWHIPEAGWAQSLGKIKHKDSPKEDKIPADLSPAQVDAHMAGLTDAQARQLLAAELKSKAAAQAENETHPKVLEKDRGLVLAFYAAQRALSALFDELGQTFTQAETSAQSQVWANLVGGPGVGRFLRAMAWLVLIVGLGWSVEKLLVHKTEKFRSRLTQEIPRFGWERAGLIFFKLIVSGLGISVYVLVTFLAHFMLFRRGLNASLVSAALLTTYYFRLIETITRVILSPQIPELRLVPMPDGDARFLYRWILSATLAVLPIAALTLALQKAGAGRELVLLVYASAGPVISILVAVLIWRIRTRVAAAICPFEHPRSVSGGLLRHRCAELWHYPAMVFALMVGIYWWFRLVTHGDVTIIKLIFSLFLVPLCIAMDHWLQQTLSRLEAKPQDVVDFTGLQENNSTTPGKPISAPLDREKQKAKPLTPYFPLIRKAFRLGLLLFLFLAALDLWGIDFGFAWIFGRSVLGVIIAVVFGLIVWEVAKAKIDKKIREEAPFQSEEAEEGGSGGSRLGTLLLLLRKAIMVFLLVVITFTILATLGVNIAPLLAGAGVIGLAIGFGSQTLVKDIIAGIFFLIDDAFRVGDYVEAGTAKGTVEAISLRSLRLRHPRGQVFVVPFGDLKMVQNFTRDYIIEKLDIRVRFDTDPDEIRKIVKKINSEIKADEQLARALLSDIKSAGVRAMDDSAMIMRVKFKCIPGEQFLIRRQVYQRLQKAFKKKGIEFAHRNVTVYMPPQPGGAAFGSAGENAVVGAAGGAAAAAIAQAEAEALAKAKETKKSD